MPCALQVVPGHVLVSPKRVVARFAELSAEEVSDLWCACCAVRLLLCCDVRLLCACFQACPDLCLSNELRLGIIRELRCIC